MACEEVSWVGCNSGCESLRGAGYSQCDAVARERWAVRGNLVEIDGDISAFEVRSPASGTRDYGTVVGLNCLDITAVELIWPIRQCSREIFGIAAP